MKTIGAADIARRVFDCEMEALRLVRDALDETFEAVLAEVLGCKGRTIVTGMGKSGHIARKIAASLSSLGNTAFFVHPGECLHGDLGMIQKDDVVIAISYSGESDEVLGMIPAINTIGAKLIAITGNPLSSLARGAAVAQTFPKFPEACQLGLAPTSSTTAALVYGDALAIAASELKGFGKDDYKVFHPAGALGKGLTIRVADCMRQTYANAHLTKQSTLADALKLLCETGWELLPVSNEAGTLIGGIHAEKIKNALAKQPDIYHGTIENNIDYSPLFASSDMMAVDVLRIMDKNNITVAMITKDDKAIGILRRDDILRHGISV